MNTIGGIVLLKVTVILTCVSDHTFVVGIMILLHVLFTTSAAAVSNSRSQNVHKSVLSQVCPVSSPSCHKSVLSQVPKAVRKELVVSFVSMVPCALCMGKLKCDAIKRKVSLKPAGLMVVWGVFLCLFLVCGVGVGVRERERERERESV